MNVSVDLGSHSVKLGFINKKQEFVLITSIEQGTGIEIYKKYLPFTLFVSEFNQSRFQVFERALISYLKNLDGIRELNLKVPS